MSLLLGIHAVQEALSTCPQRLRRVILARERSGRRAHQLAEMARVAGVPVHRRPRPLLDRLAPGEHHQGVVAEWDPLDWLGLEELLARTPAPALLVGLDRVQDPRNFGAIARSVESAGAHGIVVTERAQAPPSFAAIQASAGALLHVPLARVTNLADTVVRVKEAGLWAVGLAPGGDTPWYAFDMTEPVFLVVGGEAKGLRPRVARSCDALVALPQRGRIGSLNAAVAVGIVLYEAVRQRQSGAKRAAGPGRQ